MHTQPRAHVPPNTPHVSETEISWNYLMYLSGSASSESVQQAGKLETQGRIDLAALVSR